MNQVNQGESSSGLSVNPLKRRRGRPRKDPSLKRTQTAHVPPPGFEGVKEYLPQRADRTDCMVGETVTGVVEATFDAGYLLTVRIGNSNTNLRGVVFKPGHYVPVTTENDVAPHLQMIRRNDVNYPADKNQNWCRAIQPAEIMRPKRKYIRKAAPSVPPVGVRGTVVPVVLQPVNFANGLPNPNQTGELMAFGDKEDVHMVEPLSMLPPDRSIPVGQIFMGRQPGTSHQVSQTSEQNASELSNGGEKAKPMESTDADNAGSSETSDVQTAESGKEGLQSSADNSGIVSKQEPGNTSRTNFSTESLQTASVIKPSFNYGAGRMTELLQAVQENMKENQVHITEQPTSAPKVELHELRTTETTDAKNGAMVP